MRLYRILLVFVLAVTFAVLAHANTDPQMILDPSPQCGSIPAVLVTLPFSFTITNPDTYYCFQSKDLTYPYWPDLTVTLPSHEYSISQVSCFVDGNYYQMCTVDPDPSDPSYALDFHWTGSPPPGISYGSLFGFDVSPPGGGTCPADDSNPMCFKTGDTFAVTSSVAVPEPSSVILIASGALGLWGRRRSPRKKA